MKISTGLASFLFAAGFAVAAHAADSTVTLSGVHLCCGSCVKGVSAAVASMSDVKATCDAPASTVTLTAPDQATLQKAVDSLVAAGYYGKSSDAAIKVEDKTNAPDGKVTSLKVDN